MDDINIRLKNKAKNKPYISEVKDLDWWIDRIFSFLGKKILFFVLIGVTLLIFLFYKNFLSDESFPIKTIEIEGAKLTGLEDIESITSKKKYESIILLKEEELKKDIGALPWISGVIVEKSSIDKIKIKITEKKPIYRFRSNELMTSNGELLDKYSEGHYKNLPKLIAKEESKKEIISAYNKYKEFFSHDDDLNVEIYRLTDTLSFEVWLSTGAIIKFGRQNLEDRIKRFNSNYEAGNLPDFIQVSVIDFRYSYGFAITWQDDVKDINTPVEEIMNISNSF